MKYTEFLERAHHGFVRRESEGVVYFAAPALEELGFLTHGFTSRVGGVSLPPYDTLNLSFTRTPDAEAVRENFRRAARALDIAFEKLVVCHYCHGSNIETARTEHHGMGITRENTLPFCDGLMVVDADTAAVTLHGDCGAIFFADRQGRAAGVCHSGWRGTLQNTVAVCIRKMQGVGVEGKDMLFAIGPCISWPHYEVQEDVAGRFRPEYPDAVKERDGKVYLDMESVFAAQLYRAGIPPENVTFSHLCTYSDSRMFYSHRRDGQNAGAMGSFICLRQ